MFVPDRLPSRLEPLLAEVRALADHGVVASIPEERAAWLAGLRQLVDPDGALADHEQQFDRRHLTLSPLLDGMTSVDGLLDPDAAATVQAALAPLLVPTGPDDDRTAAQRRADALVEVAVAAMRAEELPLLSGTAAALDVTVDWLDLRAGCGVETGSGFLPGPTLGRLACDASVSRVLMGPGSVPLDLGRSVRLFSRHQRRALAARDRGCRFPACPRPPRHTDAHHVLPRLHGGATDLRNLASS